MGSISNVDNLLASVGSPSDAKVIDPTLSASEIALLKGLLYQLQNGGTQYTDASSAPAHPIGNQIMFNNGGTETAVSAANPLPSQDIETAGYIALSSPPAQTNAGNETQLTFASQANRVIIANNTSANINYAFDATASAGSLLLVPGAMLVYPKKCTVLHLYTAAAQNINGTSAGNIVVLGAL